LRSTSKKISGRGAAGDYGSVKEGDQVKRTGRIMSIPVGDAMVGRVVNALGQPIDDKGPIQTTGFNALERLAPGVVDRQPVKQPLQTGIKAIRRDGTDWARPRELIIGDRQTGKTTVALDTIINQRARRYLYLCSDRAEALDGGAGGAHVRTARRDGVHHRSGRRRLPIRAMQYIAPYAAAASANSFAIPSVMRSAFTTIYRKHAAAYREISLLLARPPGRERFRATCSICTAVFSSVRQAER